MEVSQKIKIEIPYNPGISLLGTYPKELKTGSQRNICTPMIIALFTVSQEWKQLKCPSKDEWIKKMWYIYTMEYYSALKKKAILSYTRHE
uniref:Uncharacterized protein n=1 Tax=Equus caballus TaxID=9796 RepID=A0A9L0S2U0_HORSE